MKIVLSVLALLMFFYQYELHFAISYVKNDYPLDHYGYAFGFGLLSICLFILSCMYLYLWKISIKNKSAMYILFAYIILPYIILTYRMQFQIQKILVSPKLIFSAFIIYVSYVIFHNGIVGFVYKRVGDTPGTRKLCNVYPPKERLDIMNVDLYMVFIFAFVLLFSRIHY